MTDNNNNSMPDNHSCDTIIVVLCAIAFLAIILFIPDINYVLMVYVIPALLYVKDHLEITKLQNRVKLQNQVYNLENPTPKPNPRRYIYIIIVALFTIAFLVITWFTPDKYLTGANIKHVLMVYVIPVLLYIKTQLEITKLKKPVYNLENPTQKPNRWRYIYIIIVVLCTIACLIITYFIPDEYLTGANIKYVLMVYVIPVLLHIKAHLEITKLRNQVYNPKNSTQKPPDEKK